MALPLAKQGFNLEWLPSFVSTPLPSQRDHGSKASSQLKPAMWPWITVLWKPCLRTTDCFLLNSRKVWGSLCWDQSWYGRAMIFLEPIEGVIKIQQLHASRIHSGFWFWFWFCFICLFFPLLPSAQAGSVGLVPGPFWLFFLLLSGLRSPVIQDPWLATVIHLQP